MKRLIQTLETIQLLALAKPFGGIQPIIVNKDLYCLVNITIFL
jgi:hypothetical protein